MTALLVGIANRQNTPLRVTQCSLERRQNMDYYDGFNPGGPTPRRPTFGDAFGKQPPPPAPEKSEVEEVVAEILEALKNANQYLALGEAVVNAAEPAIIKALMTLLNSFNKVRGSLEPELDQASQLSAEALRRDYENYAKAGFDENQAFQLVLAAIKPFSFAELVKAASEAKSKDK